MEEEKYKVWLSLISGLGIKKYIKLIEKFGSKQKLWEAKKDEIIKVKGIDEKIADMISKKEIKQDINRHLKFMKENNIKIISIEDEEYPVLLKNIYNPPINLYIRGNKNILNNLSIGIIGCRDFSEYGKRIAEKFSYHISKNNINIISGLAYGIDSFAHIGAIMAKQRTIAILGNGLDTIYPKENIKIANKILELEGAIISEFPLGTRPQKINFPSRNRIISGMSKGILVVEAKEKSGTLITVDFALEQGRDVFVIPGNIDSENSVGTNELIKQGAKLVTDWKEIVEEYLVCNK